MERWMTPDFGRLMMFLGIGMISLSVIIGLVARKIRSTFKPFSKKAIWYMVGFAALFALTSLLITTKMFSSYAGFFIFYQVLFLLYGCLHVYLMKLRLNWGEDDMGFVAELIYTVLIMLLGMIAFMLVYRLANREGLEFSMMLSVLIFIVPLFVWQTFQAALGIPPKVLNQWYYPVHEPKEDPDETKLKNMLLISFEFQKNGHDPYFTNFRARAPVDMDLGELFYYFINDYNERHPNGQILYSNGTGKPYGWMFYKKPKWYTILTRYMDADKTIFLNRIRENDVIVCARIM
jgi:hypothetical protein